MRDKLEYLNDMAKQLAIIGEADGLEALAYLFRLAQAETELLLGQSPKRAMTNYH